MIPQFWKPLKLYRCFLCRYRMEHRYFYVRVYNAYHLQLSFSNLRSFLVVANFRQRFALVMNIAFGTCTDVTISSISRKLKLLTYTDSASDVRGSFLSFAVLSALHEYFMNSLVWYGITAKSFSASLHVGGEILEAVR